MNQPVTPPMPAPLVAPPLQDSDMATLDTTRAITEVAGPIPEHTFVRIHNPTNVPLALKYVRTRWVVPAGAEIAIPYYCAVLWFGDPRATDDPTDRRKRFRTNELERVAAKWGLYDSGRWETIPQVRIHDLGGHELFFPALDPDGTKRNPNALHVVQVQAQQEAMAQDAMFHREKASQLEAENERLKNELRLREMEGGDEDTGAIPDLTAPSPTTVTPPAPELILPDHGVQPEGHTTTSTSSPEQGGTEGAAVPDDLDEFMSGMSSDASPEAVNGGNQDGGAGEGQTNVDPTGIPPIKPLD